jgi:hypothetical protein
MTRSSWRVSPKLDTPTRQSGLGGDSPNKGGGKKERASPEHDGVSAMATNGRFHTRSGEVLQMWEGEKVAPQHESEDKTGPTACSPKGGRSAAAQHGGRWLRSGVADADGSGSCSTTLGTFSTCSRGQTTTNVS